MTDPTGTRFRCLRSGFFPGAALFLGLLCASPSAARQAPTLPGQLPCELAARATIEASAEAQIREFIGKNIAGLSSETPSDVMRAREALLQPLMCQAVSVAFRLKYSEIAEPLLAPLIRRGADLPAINALQVLGQLKTPGAIRPIESALGDQREPIRAAAAAAFRELMSKLGADSTGFPDNAVDRLLDQIAAALAKETSPAVCDLLILGLGDAPEQNAALQSRSVRRMCEGLRQRIAAIRKEEAADPRWLMPIFRGLDLARLTVLNQAVGGVDKDLARKSGVLAGEALAFARDHMNIDDPSRQVAKIVGTAERLLVIGHSALTSERVSDKGLERAFEHAVETADIAPFSSAIDAWIGKGGILTKPPYSAQETEFAPRPR